MAPRNEAAGGRVTVITRAVRPGDLERVWEMIRGLAEYEKLTDILTGSRDRLHALLFDRPPALFGQVAERADARLVGYALYHFTYSSFRTNARRSGISSAKYSVWLFMAGHRSTARVAGAGRAIRPWRAMRHGTAGRDSPPRLGSARCLSLPATGASVPHLNEPYPRGSPRHGTPRGAAARFTHDFRREE